MSWYTTARDFVVRWGRPARFAAKHVISAVPGGSLVAEAVDMVLECVQDTAVDQQKAEARLKSAGANNLERVGSILEECSGQLAGLMEQIVKLDGLPDQADQIIRQQRDTDKRIAAGFANMARFAQQFDRIENFVRDIKSRMETAEETDRHRHAEIMAAIGMAAIGEIGPSPPKQGDVITNSIGMKLAWVPPAKFWIGGGTAPCAAMADLWPSGGAGLAGHKQVDIAQGFYLGIYPVTQEEWQRVMGNNPSYFSGADRNQLPVEQVSWDDAQEFIKNLKGREQDAGWVYRLPTEAEWEYACRGAASSEEECSFDFYFDKPTNDLTSEQANFDGNYPAGRGAKGKFLMRTTKVGSYRPNRLGIYDMHGNVWEWCDDLHEGPVRGCRGGCWPYPADACRAQDTAGYTPSYRRAYLGFRLARVRSASK